MKAGNIKGAGDNVSNPLSVDDVVLQRVRAAAITG
jgi:hypothetical protein